MLDKIIVIVFIISSSVLVTAQATDFFPKNLKEIAEAIEYANQNDEEVHLSLKNEIVLDKDIIPIPISSPIFHILLEKVGMRSLNTNLLGLVLHCHLCRGTV